MEKTNKMSKTFLLERSIASLEYQIELSKAYLPVYQEKLDAKLMKKEKSLKKKYLPRLIEVELDTLSNQEYLNHFTKDKLAKLDKEYYWKKRAYHTSYHRKKLKLGTDQVKLEQAKALLDQQVEALTKRITDEKNLLIETYSNRKYSNSRLEANQKVYQNLKIEVGQLVAKELEGYKKHVADLKIKASEKSKSKVISLESKLEKQKKKLNDQLSLNPEEQEKMDSIISSDSILKIDNLTMQFGGLKAVDQLTFEVKKGEIFGLIGPNGAGKTTVFNCITQFYKSTQGKVLYRDPNGRVLNLNSYKVHDVIQTGIVRTFQNVELIWELSILDNMLVGAHSLYRSRFVHHSFQTFSYKREESILRARAEKILTDLNLIAYKHFYPIGLPYGVLKRIELARTLMTNPSLIILDEPAAGLNDAETEELAHTIKKIQSDYHCTIFLVEHDMGLVMSICDTICAISFGRKLAIGTASEIQKSPVVQEAYLGGE
jgi:branched-chain amino acid transport system ATP-binding protein